MGKLEELGVVAQSLDGGGGEGRLAVCGFPERFGAAGAAGAVQPRQGEGFGDEAEVIGGNGGFLLLANGVADANEEAGQQQGDPKHGAAGIGGQGAGTAGIEQFVEPGK